MQTLTHQYWLVKERQMELLAESQQQMLLYESQRARQHGQGSTARSWRAASLATVRIFYGMVIALATSGR